MRKILRLARGILVGLAVAVIGWRVQLTKPGEQGD